MAIEVRLLGAIEARRDGAPVDLRGARQRRLLAYLSLAVGSVRPIDAVCDAVWSNGDAPDDPKATLHTYVSRLRGSLGGTDIVVARDGGYVLDLDRESVDAIRFERLVASAAAPGVDGCHRIDVLTEALALWHGAALEGVEDADWALPHAVRLEELRANAIDDRAEALVESDRAAEAVPDLESAAIAQPLRDRTHRLLMSALHRSGRQGEALRVAHDFRHRLATDLGLEPSEALRALESSIASGDTNAGADTAPGVRGYVLGDRIGDGAFAVVYRGTQPAVGRQVAVKVIRAELANRPEFVRRFEAEAHLVARLEHPHVVPLYDYWREPGSAYLVMRLLHGGTLEALLADRTLTVAEAATMVTQVGAALAAAHRAGVVHRDVKPANIFLDGDGNFFLGDFGIAYEIAAPYHATDSLSIGSPAYASPEQLRREPVGPPADVHGLGIALFEALTGQLPFPDAHTQADLVARQLNDPLPSARARRPELSAQFDAVLTRATAKDPVERHATVDAFVADVTAALGDGSSAAAPFRHRPGVATALGERRNPYKGLRAFQEADAADFCGRQRLVDRIVQRLAGIRPADRLVAVIGPSGSGKSSVVRAGVLPALRAGALAGSREWFVTSMVPGAYPFEELEAALQRIASGPLSAIDGGAKRGIARGVKQALPTEDGELLLVVDQFEELFTLCTDDAVRHRFIAELVAAVSDPRSRLRVLLTLRADFYDRPLRYPELAPLIEESAVAVSPLAPDELELAIVEPASRAGSVFEPGLVARIVADVVDQPGALPLLQYALTELFERQVSGLLTVRDYEAVGGMVGALARRADELFEEGTEAERSAARRLFTRLVTLGEGTEDTRRRVRLSELGADDATAAVVQRYGAARLLSFDRDPASREPTVEVAHEALLREWRRLRGWLDDDRDGLRVHRHLTVSATGWETSGRDRGELYRGGRLETAEQWLAAHPDEPNAAEAAFVDASAAQRTAERAAEVRGHRRIRRALVAVAVVAALALLAGGLAFQQRGSALTAAGRADRAAAEAETRRLVADAAAIVGENRDVALLLASEAYRRDPGPRTLAGLQRVLTSTGPYLGTIGAGQDFVAGGYLDDGTVVGVTADAVRFYDAATSAEVRTVALPAPMLAVRYFAAPVHIAADSVAVGTQKGSVLLVRGGASREIAVSTVAIRSVHARGDVLVAGDVDGNVRLLDLATGAVRWTTQVVPESSFRDVMGMERWDALSPALAKLLAGGDQVIFHRGPAALDVVADGSIVVVAGPTLRRLDTGTGAIVDSFVLYLGEGANSYPRPIRAIAPRPDGRVLMVGIGFATELTADLDPVSTGFPPTGRADANVFATTFVLDRTGTPWFGLVNGQVGKGIVASPLAAAPRFATGVSSITMVALARDGGRLLVAGDGGLVIWAIDGRQLLARAVPRGLHAEANISADGTYLMASSLGAQAPPWLYDLSGPEPTRANTSRLPATGEYAIDAEASARLIVQISTPTAMRVFDRVSLVLLAEVADAGYWSFSADGRLLAVMTLDTRTVRVFETSTWHQVSPLIDVSSWKAAAGGLATIPTFDTTGRRLLVSMYDGTTVAFDADTWQPYAEIMPDDHGGAVSARFSRDGTILVTRGVDQTISIRDGQTFAVSQTITGGTTTGDGLSAAIYLSADNQYALTFDAQPRLWHLPSATLIGGFPRQEGTVASGNDLGTQLRLATIEGEHALSWNLDVTSWPAIACRAAGRNLTAAEWEQFGPRDEPYVATCSHWPATA